MASIQITQVGDAEFPLLQVLRDTVFSEFGHVSNTPLADNLTDQKDLLVLMAHQEGNPVGFSAGYQRVAGVYYVNYVALLSDYRRQGLGRQLLLSQEEFAHGRGYRQIQFNTFNHFPGMIRLGLSLGYLPIGIEQHEG